MEKKDYRLASMPSAQCHVVIKRYGESDNSESAIEVELWSYATHVLTISYSHDGVLKLEASGTYSVTTARHINRFTTEFLGSNYYHKVKTAINGFEYFYVVFVRKCEDLDPVKTSFFSAIQRYNVSGKRFYGRY